MNILLKKRISFLSLVLLGLFFAGALTAQQGRPERGPESPPPLPDPKEITAMVNDLTTELTLSEEQNKKISELFNAHFEEMRQHAKAFRKSMEEDRQLMDKKREDFEKEINALLSDEQQKRFKNFREEHGPKNSKKPDKRR